MRSPRPALTFLLMLAAAAMVLAGGAWLARRTVEDRVPVDRTLLRETAAVLQEELARLDVLFAGHLRRCAALVRAGVAPEEIRRTCGELKGLELLAVLPRQGSREWSVSMAGPGSLPPMPEWMSGNRRPASPFALGVPVEEVFGSGKKDGSPLPLAEDGWFPKQGGTWLAWWQRLDPERAVVIVIKSVTVAAAVEGQLVQELATAWGPVRAAGGLDVVEGASGRVLAGAAHPEGNPGDFIVPLVSRLGNWQITSWDRRVARTVYDIPTLAVTGSLAAGLAALGWVVAAGQRRALREVTARVSFVNRVSHELSAPLTNLQLSLDLAGDCLSKGGLGEAQRRLGVAQEETARLGRLVANVLDFARRGRGQPDGLHAKACLPALLVERVLDQFSPALARREIELETMLDAGFGAELDADAFSQIVANLMSNVEKYAAAGKWAGVSLTKKEGTFRLTVSDRGPGIPEAEAERVFLPFERLDSRITEGVSGTGLGLAIARDLAGRMGGSVVLRPRVPGGTGAVFEVILPLSQNPETTRLPQGPTASLS